MTLLQRDYSGDPWANTMLVALRLAMAEKDRPDHELDEPGAYFGSVDPDSGDTIIAPLTGRNVCEWAEALASVALR
jgi:hypothetical protein